MDCFVTNAPLRKRFAFVAGNDGSVFALSHAFSDATPSISISMAGFGNACTTQVVRAG